MECPDCGHELKFNEKAQMWICGNCTFNLTTIMTLENLDEQVEVVG